MGGASSSYSADIAGFGYENVKPLLILDLNDLLVRRTPQKQTRNSVKVGRSWLQTRNDLKPFLQTIFDRYTVAVWSAALPFNVDAMCAHVFGSYRSQLLFEWSQVRGARARRIPAAAHAPRETGRMHCRRQAASKRPDTPAVPQGLVARLEQVWPAVWLSQHADCRRLRAQDGPQLALQLSGL